MTAQLNGIALAAKYPPMMELFEANWHIAAIAAAIVLLLALLLLRSRKAKRRERHRAPDALDEGAAPAVRNQAYIDAPSYASLARADKVGEPEA
jgi:membrane protein implicated in regulation of membrane protease activity